MKPFHAATMNNLPNTALIDMTKTVFVRFDDVEGYVISVPEAMDQQFKSLVAEVLDSTTHLDSIAIVCDKFGLQMLYVKGEK